MTFKTFQLSLDKEETQKLDIIAKNEERSRSFMVRKAIQRFLEEVDNDGN